MMEKPVWWEYATFDDDFVNGIRDNAPEEIKKAYRDYLEIKEKGLKI